MHYLISNRLSIFTLTIAVSIFILPSVCFSTNLSVSIGKPYANGALTIIRGTYDTINFSNGISFSFFNQTTSIPEPVKLDYGIAIDSGNNLVKAGFRYSQSAIWQKSSVDSMLKFYKSTDTIWAASKTYPDSITQLDSLFEVYYMPHRTGKGKWLYYEDGESSPIMTSWVGKIENFNNIIYIQANQNKMKLQVSFIYVNVSVIYWHVDSLRILWAVDSLGNGKFTDFTNIKGNNKPSEKSKSSPSFNLRNNNDLKEIQNSGEHFTLYDIRGKQISTISNKSDHFSGGVFFCKIDGNKKSTFYKIIAK